MFSNKQAPESQPQLRFPETQLAFNTIPETRRFRWTTNGALLLFAHNEQRMWVVGDVLYSNRPRNCDFNAVLIRPLSILGPYNCLVSCFQTRLKPGISVVIKLFYQQRIRINSFWYKLYSFIKQLSLCMYVYVIRS